jgi:O-antigen/teichoic acid export membrane protein
MIGSIVALALALAITRLKLSAEAPADVPSRSFVVQNIIYFVGLNLFFAVDIWFVKYFLSDHSVGLYVSSSTLARITYMFSIALSAVLLPSLARYVELKETARVREISQDSLRYLMIFLALLITVMAINSREIITLFFGPGFVAASPSLILLTIGHALVTMMAIINTIMIAFDKMKPCFTMITVLLAGNIMLNLVLVPRFELQGAAAATIVVGAVGTIWGGFHIFDVFRRVIFSWSALRIPLSPLVNLLPRDVFLKTGLVSAAYFALLWLTREVSAIDIRRLKESAGIS